MQVCCTNIIPAGNLRFEEEGVDNMQHCIEVHCIPAGTLLAIAAERTVVAVDKLQRRAVDTLQRTNSMLENVKVIIRAARTITNLEAGSHEQVAEEDKHLDRDTDNQTLCPDHSPLVEELKESRGQEERAQE